MRFPWRRNLNHEIIDEDKILFIADGLNVIDLYPIVEAKKWKWDWVKKARADFQKDVDDGKDKFPGYSHVSRCPGIIDICKEGYIMQTNNDVMIDPFEEGFNYIVSGNPPKEGRCGVFDGVFGEQVLDRTGVPMDSEQGWVEVSTLPLEMTKVVPKPDYFYPYIYKYHTGWQVITPPGVRVLIIPIPYPDEHAISHSFGVLDTEINTQLNAQCFISKAQKEFPFTIKAGTPICQIIPLVDSSRKLKFEQRYKTAADDLWFQKLQKACRNSFTNPPSWPKIKKMYKQFWHEGVKIP